MFKKMFLLFAAILMPILPVFALDDDISMEFSNGIYTFKIPLAKYKNKIKPYVSDELTTASEVFKARDCILAVNGGFFDPINNLPVSNVVIDNIRVQNLFQNLELVKKLDETERLEKVLNRSELRILENSKGNISFDITEHFAPVKENWHIKHSIQAEPMLLPSLRLEEESFIKFENNKPVELAADVLKRRERTIIGLKNNNISGDDLYIIIFTKDNKSALNEVRDYCLRLGLDKAMAFDGGVSTQINYKSTEISSS
ncbi:MAG: phosphodiester glycosidase family protein, partial [Candidatus Gastranaerophilales bacterium]|nr:phosphodiester glycosidase family protein [Candidatus Gastranaerophilales bacterium]